MLSWNRVLLMALVVTALVAISAIGGFEGFTWRP